MSKFKV